jgi:hypothetical protein
MTDNNHIRSIVELNTRYWWSKKSTTAEVRIATTRPLFIAAGAVFTGRASHLAYRSDIHFFCIRNIHMGKPDNRNTQIDNDQEYRYMM